MARCIEDKMKSVGFSYTLFHFLLKYCLIIYKFHIILRLTNVQNVINKISQGIVMWLNRK
ncbi:hypothetical protein CIB95_01670 [Lottiidibacillus patelloidae]|uniref:Uncharacterized protein n=1 Tax=Lottiidibacillus patelloidae TaxID=2670334 RepID=A0A263BYR3_9BACI|nr:hypothetical protein CIB95_01670 [Lottiidibacillus patelloidae]